MKKIERYIFFRLWGPFLFGLVGTTLIIALDPLQKALEYYFNNQVDGFVVWSWFINSIPKDMLFIFPTSSMLAGLLVFSQLSRDSELVAIQAGGIGLISILKPVFLFGILVLLSVFYIQDKVIPPALKIRTDLFRTKIRQYEEPKIRNDVVMRLSSDRLLFIGEIDLLTKELRKIVVKEYLPLQRWIVSSNAVLQKNSQWKLTAPMISIWPGANQERVINQLSEDILYDLDLQERDLENYEEKRSQEMSYREILDLIDYHQERAVISTLPLQVDFYNKLAFPFAVLLFSVLGALMGISSHRGGGFVGFGISLVFSFLYFFVMGLAMPIGKNGFLHPFIAGWTQNILFLAVCIFTFWRVWKR
ncbi:MAG: LptF/LptG family permease [Candidatus Cloacimonetes bacterium]|nr:LptF/LptG family permease [Candidatus Cloacimonadota bacterium]